MIDQPLNGKGGTFYCDWMLINRVGRIGKVIVINQTIVANDQFFQEKNLTKANTTNRFKVVYIEIIGNSFMEILQKLIYLMDICFINTCNSSKSVMVPLKHF